MVITIGVFYLLVFICCVDGDIVFFFLAGRKQILFDPLGFHCETGNGDRHSDYTHVLFVIRRWGISENRQLGMGNETVACKSYMGYIKLIVCGLIM